MPQRKTEAEKRAVRNEVQRRYNRSVRLRAADDRVQAAACLLEPRARCVAYYRNGLRRLSCTRDAQQRAVEHLVGIARARLVGTYEEAENTHPDNRPELDAAIRRCQAGGLVLIIGRLGLMHTSKLLCRLAESGIRFIACDRQNVNHCTVAALAADAQRKEPERRESHKKAVAEAKARGVRFGPDPSVCRAALKRGTEAWCTLAKQHALRALAFVEAARRAGCRTNIGIAEALNECGIRTVRGHLWTAKAIANLARWRSTDRTPEILRIGADAAMRGAVKKSAPAPDFQAAPSPAPSGFPGRPNSRPLVKAELRRRWEAGERHPSRKRGGGESALQWGRVLSGWLAAAHSDEPSMGIRAARAFIAECLRELDAMSPASQKREVAEITAREVAEII